MSEQEDNFATLSVACGPLAAPVLARVLAMLASRANLSIDRLNDAVLIGDAIAAHARGVVSNGRVRVRIGVRPAALEIRVGPLVESGAGRLHEAATVPGAGNVLDRLADEVSVETDGGAEYLLVGVASPARQAG